MSKFLQNVSDEILQISEFSVASAKMLISHAERLLFVGNGGSAAIASHMATDWTKNGGKLSLAFNDSSALTCVANDFGYDKVFSQQIEWHGRFGDLLIAISSSGRSKNIINAVDAARKLYMPVITLSGFDSNNPLLGMGDVNFYVGSHDYGVVEVTHLAIIHSMIGDLK